MRKFLLLLILLIISLTTYSQNTKKTLYLEVFAKSDSDAQILKTLTYNSLFTERNQLQEQIDSLSTQIKTVGYIDLTTEVQEKNDSTILVEFDFGPLYKTTQLYLKSDPILYTYIKETGITIKNDSIEIETAFAKAYLKELANIASNLGDPFASFQISEISKTTNRLHGILNLSSNEKRTIDRYVLNGYTDFPKSYLRHYARLKEGATFNQKDLIKQNELLETLPFVSTTKEPEVLFKKDSTIVYYYLKRNTVNRFDGFLGFASDQNNNLGLDGYLDLLLTNNLNYGESLSLNYKADGDDQSQLRISTTLPYLFQTPVGFQAEIALFRRDSTFSTSDISANFLYTLSANSSIGLGYRSKASENLGSELIVPNLEISNFVTNGGQTTYNYTKQQSNYFFPIKTHFSISSGYSIRTTETERLEQIPLEIEAEHIFQLNPTNGIYIRNITKYLSSDNYVTNELYRFGGIQSIRGFEENSLFANTLSIINTEYRLTLNQGLYVNTIIDVAYFENKILNQKSELLGVGVGAGVRTRAGILQINLANGKFKDLPFRFSNTKLHLILAIRF